MRRAWVWPVLAAAALAAYAVLHSPLFLVRQVRVDGLVQLSSAEVLRAADIPEGAYLWQVRPWIVARRIDLLPLVAGAQVQLLWPDRIAIDVRERQPVFQMLEGDEAVEVDADGRVILREPAATVPPGLPVVAAAGLSPAGLVPGRRLPDEMVARQAVEVARGLGVEGRAVVAVIDIASDGEVALRLRSGLEVRFGDGSDARRKTEELLGMLQVIRDRGLKVADIDLASAATPSLKLQAAH